MTEVEILKEAILKNRPTTLHNVSKNLQVICDLFAGNISIPLVDNKLFKESVKLQQTIHDFKKGIKGNV